MTLKPNTMMASGNPMEVAALKRLVAGIIRSQGNRFVKELLREKGIRIGENKDQFERNLTEAIGNGKLTLQDFEGWLKDVEGWGNQHVYLYRISPSLGKELTVTKLQQRVKAAGLTKVWNGDTILAFPDEPELTSISFANSVLRLVWQEASPGWTPVPEKNYMEEEGLDTFEYRAFRKVERRAITRFEAHVDKGLAGLFIANPIQGEEHQAAINEAKRVIELLMDLSALERGRVDISTVSRNVDQRNIPTNNKRDPDVRTQKSRLESGGAYIEFAAHSKEKAYWEEPAVESVRQSVRAQQLPSFRGSEGLFTFGAGDGSGNLTRPLRVQLYGKDDRIRLWAQMEAGEVWTILTKLSGYE